MTLAGPRLERAIQVYTDETPATSLYVAEEILGTTEPKSLQASGTRSIFYCGGI